MSSSGRREMQATAAAEMLIASTPQTGFRPMSTHRPSSGPSSARSARLVGSRSESNVSPRTAGRGSIGLDTPLTVESRPVTHHGMTSMRVSSQGPGRKILDKSYFLGKLRSKKQELQAEIDTMNTEIDRLQKRGPASIHIEHHQESLMKDVKLLRVQLGEYNMVMEKVAAGVELDQLKDNLRIMKEKNDKERQKFDHLFSEQSKLSKKVKEKETEEFEKHACLLETELEHRLDQAADKRDKYLELKRENQQLLDEVEELENKLEDLNNSIEPLEQDLLRASPTKQKAVILVEQCLIAENELQRLKSGVPLAQMSPAEAREAKLTQIRQENAEIARAEEKSIALEAEIKTLKDELVAAENALSELKGGRADKFLEMQQKDKKMQSFIDDFERIHRERTEAIRLVKEKIDILLEHVNCSVNGDGTINNGCSANTTQDVEGLTQDLDERKRELKQLEELELKTRKEISSCRQKIACLQAEIEKFTSLDELRASSESKCSKLEEEKKVAEGKALSVQVQLKEQTMRLELLQKQVSESLVDKSLKALNHKLLTIQQSISKAQEEIDAKERELNYIPVLENIRFMVAQLNGEIKNTVTHGCPITS